MLIFAIQKNQIQNSNNQTTIEQIDDAFGVNLLYLRHKQKQSQPLQRDTRPIYIHLTMMKFILTPIFYYVLQHKQKVPLLHSMSNFLH
jgi:hypothetical protein